MSSNTQRLSIALLIALIGFPQISETLYTPALPKVASGLIASAQAVEATLAIYFLGFAVGVLLWGILSDWSGRRKAMLAALFLYGIATIGCAAAGHIEALLAWRFVQAFGASAGSVITQTILREAFDGEKRTRLFALFSGALAFSPAIGPLAGGFISEYFGWRANFWTLTVLALALITWTYFTLPETRTQQTPRPTLRHIRLLFLDMMKNSRLLGHVLLVGATNGIIFGFYQEAPFVFITQLGMHPTHYGCFGLLIASATLLSARISYRQSNRFAPEQFIRFGTACVCSGALLLTLTVLFGAFSLNPFSLITTIVTLFLIFFGIGLIIPNSLSHALKPYTATAGTASSLFGGAYYVCIATFTWMLSLLHNGTALPLPLYITALGFILVWGSFRVSYVKKSDREMTLDL